MKVEPLPADAGAIALPCELDAGETEEMRLCQHLSADKVILDDALGRGAARSLGLKFTGLLGEPVFAKLAGRVGTVKAEIERLRAEARFFVRAEVEAVILAQTGEWHGFGAPIGGHSQIFIRLRVSSPQGGGVLACWHRERNLSGTLTRGGCLR